MTVRMLVVMAAIACASCDGRQPTKADQSVAPPENQPTQAPKASPDVIKPGGLPDDRTPISEGKIDPKGAQGAGQVLQRFGGLLEQRKFAEAYGKWSDGGRASGMTEAQFAAGYEKYAEIHSEVGAPGPMEGAAGSAYVDIPFRLYGKLKTGEPFNLVGPVTLRRVNDVPGSTAEQRQWHIYRSEVQPRP
ncbi:hypothetical protein LVY65_12810 [Sphingomonas sp. G124]|uniref:Uncharacterized protein n=1 Tax=Sphingomonas cremea TaxID=2904799 RepID=A0A9X1QPK3_9SPHN|nr:hypothetical protein [Sphingomonas cremea]MCF2515937.1 hypothetical protein [Sphingomonas cremea]